MDWSRGGTVRVIIAGPGRAGGALALAANRAGHEIVGLLARDPSSVAVASLLDVAFLSWDQPLPTADLLVIAVRDDAIADVCNRLAPFAGDVAAAIHLSGLTSVAVLAPMAERGLETGSLHPLQTLPTAIRGAESLAGSYAALTAEGDLALQLFGFAQSIGMRVFDLADGDKALYHAAAAASSNYVVAALDVAVRLYEAAGVDPVVAGPLIESVVANVLAMGGAALTGPIARGDVATVAGQVAAIERRAPEVRDAFVSLGRVTATLAGTTDVMGEVLA
jgi:predicted short-subunit dehydrogenase-like oxidoreductase (DUF2520 family)